VSQDQTPSPFGSSVTGFYRRHGINRSRYYSLRAVGLAPRTVPVDRRPRILPADEQAFLQTLTAGRLAAALQG